MAWRDQTHRTKHGHEQETNSSSDLISTAYQHNESKAEGDQDFLHTRAERTPVGRIKDRTDNRRKVTHIRTGT